MLQAPHKQCSSSKHNRPICHNSRKLYSSLLILRHCSAGSPTSRSGRSIILTEWIWMTLYLLLTHRGSKAHNSSRNRLSDASNLVANQ